ncbi:hypothetical protein C4N84_004820 [Escherichia coli]|nr:hypothetical protein [Escherichia coli]
MTSRSRQAAYSTDKTLSRKPGAVQASHRLCSASSVWQTVPEHHVPLWQQVSQVEHRPLSACEERL